MDLPHLDDDQIRRELLQRLASRFETEQRTDPSLLFQDRTPFAFALSRHGNMLTVDQAQGPTLMRGQIDWRWTPDHDAPFTFRVTRAMNGRDLVMTPGPTGPPDVIIENIVRTFLTQTANQPDHGTGR